MSTKGNVEEVKKHTQRLRMIVEKKAKYSVSAREVPP